LVGLPYKTGFGFLKPALGAWINVYIPGEERATVISLKRTLLLPFSAAEIAAMGILSDLQSPRLAYLFGLSAILIAILVYVKVPEKKYS